MRGIAGEILEMRGGMTATAVGATIGPETESGAVAGGTMIETDSGTTKGGEKMASGGTYPTAAETTADGMRGVGRETVLRIIRETKSDGALQQTDFDICLFYVLCFTIL